TRPQDVLLRSLQPTIATHLGYKDRSQRVRLQEFMREYYTHSRRIYLITRTIEERLALTPVAPTLLPRLKKWLGRKPAEEPVVDGFKFIGGKVVAASNRIFDDSPRRLMRAFLLMQQRGLTLHPDLAHLIRNKLALVNNHFQHDEHV